MTKANKLFKINVIVLVLMAVVVASIFMGFTGAKAETEGDEPLAKVETQERGIYVNMSLSLDVDGNGHVIATAKNEFTLGYSTIIVMVELYSSYTYQEDVNNMEFEGRNRTEDLDIHKTIQVAKHNNWEKKYWVAQVEYNQDGRGWKTLCTPPVLIDENGDPVDM